MMAKKPDDRPTYQELIQRLTGVLARIDPGSVPEIIASSRERSRPNLVLPTGPSASLAGEAIAVPARAGRPTWLIVCSALCAALFVAGLVVYLQRDTTPPAAQTGSAAPVPPAGMLLVTKPDGTPWLFVAQKPVSSAAFRAVFADHAGSGDEPVTKLSYAPARSYAGTRGGRLLRADEWDAAAALPSFVTAAGLSEWVERPEGTREVKKQAGGGPRPDGPQKDVTFRMAKDI